MKNTSRFFSSHARNFVLLCAIITIVIGSEKSEAQWRKLGRIREETGALINHCFFLRDQGFPNTGFACFVPYVCVDGVCDSLYRTDDGGVNWKGCAVPEPNDFILDVVFKDSLTGWAITANHMWSFGNIYSTTDGGKSWEVAATLPPGHGPDSYNIVPVKIFYYAPAQCIIVSTNQGLLISQDDGATFRFLNYWPNADGGGLVFFDDTTYLQCSFGDGYNLFRTTNGGNSWNVVNSFEGACAESFYSPITQEVYSISGESPNGHDTLYVSSDRGNSWQERYIFGYNMKSEVEGSCQGIAAIAADSNGVWFSSDFGHTWDSLGMRDVDGYNYFLSMDETGIYACDGNCNVYKYDLPNRSLSASASETYLTKSGYETDVMLDINSIFKQFPLSSFEALVHASFSLSGVSIQTSPGWTITEVPLDSQSIYLSYARDTSLTDTSASPSISIIYPDSSNADISISVMPVLVNGQTFIQCIDDSTYTFHPGCGDPLLRAALNGESLLSIQNIVPNPSTDAVQISFINPASSAISYQIFDALGETRMSGITESNALTLDISSLPQGVYFFRATNGTGFSASNKLVIVR